MPGLLAGPVLTTGKLRYGTICRPQVVSGVPMKTAIQRGTACATVAILATILSMASFAADEDDEQLEDDSERCISLARIDRTHILDDYNILFYMRGKKVYINKLPRKCPGLRRADSFMYKTSLSQLCDLDIITALDNIGFGFSRGASCGLGKFYPIDKERAKELRGQKAPRRERIEPAE